MTTPQKLYIVGHPVSHSKSPAMYNALYQRLHLSWTYDFADLKTDSEAKEFFAKKEFLSCNITTPFKQIAFKAASIPAASAKLAGGANVLVNLASADAVIGYNVDGLGCIGFLEMQGVTFADAHVVICGTGPTSVAILQAAAEAGAQTLTLLSRSKEKAQKRLDAYLDEYCELLNTAIPMPSAIEGHLSFEDAYKHATFQYGDYEGAEHIIASADVIIDATPLGMQSDDSAPFNTTWLVSGQTVMDVVYGHGETQLIQAAKRADAQTFNGAGMLVCQAIDTAQILFDIFAVDNPFTRKEMFTLMAEAAEFSF